MSRLYSHLLSAEVIRCLPPWPHSLEKRGRPQVPGSGRLLMAVVLPFRPFVEDGTRKTPPTERLPLDPNGERGSARPPGASQRAAPRAMSTRRRQPHLSHTELGRATARRIDGGQSSSASKRIATTPPLVRVAPTPPLGARKATCV